MAAPRPVPVAVKEDFPAGRPLRRASMLGINVGSAISSALAVPIARRDGELALVARRLLAHGRARRRLAPAHPARSRPTAALRSAVQASLAERTALAAGGIFGSMAVRLYGLNAWLPDAYVERGWSEGRAGALLAVSTSRRS